MIEHQTGQTVRQKGDEGKTNKKSLVTTEIAVNILRD